MREIVLDTETTGLDPFTGDRIVEIGAVELLNHMPTGRSFHQHVNPQRAMPAEAEAVHGLTASFLADKPVFAAVADAFLAFIGDARLVIHNAAFDMKFLNAELGWAGKLQPCAGPGCRYARSGEKAVSRRAELPGRPLPSVWCRQLRANETRRVARFRTARRNLSRTDRRTAAGPHVERGLKHPGGRQDGRLDPAAPPASARAADHRGGGPRPRGLHRGPGRGRSLAAPVTT